MLSSQMLMQNVLRRLAPKKILNHLDVILVLRGDAGDLLNKFKEVCERIKESHLGIHPAKCHRAVN